MQPIAFTLGAVSLALSWAVLLWSEEPSFARHMAAHMGVVAVAAPLLALGMVGGQWPRASNVYLPLLASLIELLAIWAWHTPLLHELARRSVLALLAEQASFLVSGLFLWITSIGAIQRGIGILALLLTAMHMTLLGALLALGPRVLYAHPHAGHGSIALDEQQAGGVIMLVLGGASYLVGGLWLAWGLLSPRVVQERREIRSVSL